MAVEIPVVIDIEGAFKDAASRISSAMKPLQEYMDKNALQIKLHIDDKTMMPVQKILENSTLSAKQLKTALADIDAQISKRAAAGGFDLSSGLKYSEKIMLQAAGALEHKINGVNDASAVMGRIFSANIDKAKAKVTELTAKIDDLTRKQNQYALAASKGSKGGALNYANAKRKIEEANAELRVAKTNLGMLEVELGKISAGGTKAVASMGRMKTAAMEMAENWRMGAMYVDRYNASLTRAGGKLGMLIKSSVQLIALHAATRFIHNIREVTAEFEMQRVALGGIIQDTEMAEDLFKKLKAAAIKSPFEIKDLVTYTKQLSAYRIETDRLFDVTMRLADVSAGLGVDMNRLILAYGQVRAASVLRGQELRQFTEAGIPLVELLAEKFQKLGREGTTTADVFKLISERAVPFKMIEEIFNDMTNAGGIFYKMQEKQSETLKGKWMKLKDALSIMYDEIGNTGRVHQGMEDIMNYTMKMMQNWRSVGKSLGSAVIAITAYKIALANTRIATNALTAAEIAQTSAIHINVVGRSALITSLWGEAAATKAQVALGNAYVAVKTKEMMATNLFTQSLYRMIAALLANPYAAAAAGVAVLVGSLIRMATKANQAKIDVDGLNKSIEQFDSTRDASFEADRLASAYDELKNKANKSAEEQKKLDDITKQLAKTFPSAISGVNEFGDAIELNTEKIREMAKTEREAIYGKLLVDQKNAEEELAKLANKRKQLAENIERGTYETVSRGGAIMTVGYTEEELQNMRDELVKTVKAHKDLSNAVEESRLKTNEFYEGVMMNGPAKPEFLGDAWKTAFQRYTVTVKDATEASRIFSDDQIRNAESLYSMLEEAAKEYKKYKEKYDQYTKSYITATTDAAREQLGGMMETARVWMSGYYKILQDYDATELIKSKNTRTSHQQDPLISLIQERMKFMQDYKKGYEELRQYLGSEGALEEEAKNMRARGMALGLGVDEQKRAATNLAQWYADMREEAFAKAKKHGATGTMDQFLSQEIKGTGDKSKTLREFQKLIQSLWDAETDINTSNMKREFDEALKRVEDELKRSETARNFFQNIFDLTGDKELAENLTVSVYGDPGSEIGERIKKSIEDALQALDEEIDSDLAQSLRNAAEKMDFRDIMSDISSFPKELQTVIRNAASSIEKYNADTANDYARLLNNYQGIKEKEIAITKAARKKEEEIERGLAMERAAIQRSLQKEIARITKETESESMRNALIAAANARADAAVQAAEDRASQATRAVISERDLELYKITKEYRLFNTTVGIMATETAAKVAQKTKKMLTDQFMQGVIDLEKYKKEIREVNRQLDKYIKNKDEFSAYLKGGIDTMLERIMQYSDDLLGYADTIKVHGFDPTPEQKVFLKRMDEILNLGNFSRIFQKGAKITLQTKIEDAAKSARKKAEQEHKTASQQEAAAAEAAAQVVTASADQMATAVAQFAAGFAEFEEIFYNVASVFNYAEKMFEREKKAMGTDFWYSGSEPYPEERFFAWNRNFVSAFEKFKSGDVMGWFWDMGEAISEAINPTEKWNLLIDMQGVQIEKLDYQYERLGKSIEKSFGSDYIANYNKQLEVLLAKQAAYLEQARLESEKGKKMDGDAYDNYKKQAKEVGDAIADMQSQLSEYFAGTDLTSAAKDFASAWLDAYKEFGSTTDAMKEKFQSMLQEMATNSLAAKVMQTILEPLFKQIDEMALTDNELSAMEIAQIAKDSPEYIERINTAMTSLMNELSAAGYNIRQQPGQFTGIKRNIANATEESITGLTREMNINNAFMSTLPTISANVAQILAIISGGTAENPSTGASYQLNNELAIGYLSALPSIDEKMATMLLIMQKFEKTISDKNSATNLNVIAVRA